MTSWRTGQKISQMYAKGGARRAGKHQAAPKTTGSERRRLIQFCICGSIFVLLVAVKLILPAKVQQLGAPLNQMLERNMDVTEVFSTVGKVFAGEDGGWGELYRSVFHAGEEEPVEAGAVVPATASPTAANADLAPQDAPSKSNASEPADEGGAEPLPTPPGSGDSGTETADASPKLETQRLTYILYSDKTLPENVSLEQQVLGFDYCTPVMGTLSSDFGYREHPVEGDEKFHYGLDIAAEEGTDIGAFAAGTVTVVGESSSYGKYVTVAHEGGFSTLYAHCSKITTTSGTPVKEGQKIAEVGQTGEATGPHLHFEIHAGSTYLDPIYYVSLA